MSSLPACHRHRRRVWFDCDPGHDDAAAILLALHTPEIELIGISTVHGNTDAQHTALNAARCLHAFSPPSTITTSSSSLPSRIKVHPGASRPLIGAPRHDAQIHGPDGLGGVVGLPEPGAPEVEERIDRVVGALEGMVAALRAASERRATEDEEDGDDGDGEDGEGRGKVSIVATGPLTNVALLVAAYPALVVDRVEQIVFMGGGVGIGNRSSVAEFNILCDPEAAQIVLDAPVRVVMLPLNVTHQALVTPAVLSRVLHGPSSFSSTSSSSDSSLSEPTQLRKTLSSLLTFFSAAYAAPPFRFTSGPPLHDALALAYVARPDLFSPSSSSSSANANDDEGNVRRMRVDVERGMPGSLTRGETVADLYGYWKDRGEDDGGWGAKGRNCEVVFGVDVDAFFDYFLDAVARCDAVSPLNG